MPSSGSGKTLAIEVSIQKSGIPIRCYSPIIRTRVRINPFDYRRTDEYPYVLYYSRE